MVASDPPTGTPYDRGDPITVYSSLPADVTCLTDYQDRVTSWQLLDFANGRGPAPAFADRVFVYPGDGPRVVLGAVEAADREGWADTGVLDAMRSASERVALVSDQPVRYAVPTIRVIPATEALGTCGVPEPTVAGSADAFSLLIRPPDPTGCPVRVDVYREGGAIVAMALYPSAP